MKGYNGWSYAPYKPFLFETGDIYICRVVPDVDRIHFEWLGENKEYYIYFRERGTEEFVQYGTVVGNECTILQLKTETDYEFYVMAGEEKSRLRLARTGECFGTVVNYLHPDDMAYSYSGSYLCSPSLVKYPDGTMLASMDVHRGKAPQNLTLIFRSDDEGKSWHYVSELMPCFWGKLFLHNDELYMLACSTEYGDVLIGKSTDKGKTFTTPTPLMRGSGQWDTSGFHKNPQNIMVHNGRIYETLEWGSWANHEYYHAVMVMSCSVEDDLLVAENWHFTPPLKYDNSWPGTVDGTAWCNIEGTLCVSPKGELLNVMRYSYDRTAKPAWGMVLAYKVDTENPDAPLSYSHSIMFPGHNSKFMIKYDEISENYYSIICRIDCVERRGARNLLSLMVSKDMQNWEVLCDLIDKRDVDAEEIGFQYVDFSFDGDDLIYLCRTAMNGAHNYHDSNYSTFHRVNNFRKLELMKN